MKNNAIYENIVINNISASSTERHTERVFRLFNDAEQLENLASKWKNVAKDKSQGHMFEQIEVTKFNLDALKKDSQLYAKTTASMGLNTDPVDIYIQDGKNILRAIQAKSANSAASTAFYLSNEKYQEMARLGPSDQVKKIEELLDQRIKAGTLKANDYEQTKRNLLKTLSYDDISSSGTTYNESLSMTDFDNAHKYANEIKIRSASTDIHLSGLDAGISSATFSGMKSTAHGLYNLIKGDEDIGQVVTNITVNTAKGFATGYSITAMSKGITHTTSHFLGEQVAKSLTTSNAPVAIASGIVESAKAITAYLKGDISSEEMLDNINHTAITSTSMFYYGALGQATIPIPILGAMIGSTVGYYVATMLYYSPLISFGECAAVKIAKERRKEVENICLAAIENIKRERQYLEKQITKYFDYSFSLYNKTFNNMDTFIMENNPELLISELEKLNNHIGKSLKFKSFEDFDDFMMSNEVLKF